MNTAYGRPEDLPFDLKMKRVVTYELPESVEDRSGVRKELEGKLHANLKVVLERIVLLETTSAVAVVTAAEVKEDLARAAWSHVNEVVGLISDITRIYQTGPLLLGAHPSRQRKALEAYGLSEDEIENVLASTDPSRAFARTWNLKRYSQALARGNALNNFLIQERPFLAESLWKELFDVSLQLRRILISLETALGAEDSRLLMIPDVEIQRLAKTGMTKLAETIRKATLSPPATLSLSQLTDDRRRALVFLGNKHPQGFTTKAISQNIGENPTVLLAVLEFLRDYDLVTYRDAPDGQRYAISGAGRRFLRDNHLT